MWSPLDAEKKSRSILERKGKHKSVHDPQKESEPVHALTILESRKKGIQKRKTGHLASERRRSIDLGINEKNKKHEKKLENHENT